MNTIPDLAVRYDRKAYHLNWEGRMDIIEVRAYGHITEEKMEQVLAEIELQVAEGEQGILFTTENLCGYDMGVRPIFIQWLLKHNNCVKKVALVSGQHLWHLLISTMAPIIGVDMATFDDEDKAKKWLGRR